MTALHSLQQWRVGHGRASRWQIGFRAPRNASGELLLTRTAVQALCAAQHRLRARAIADQLAAGERYYETALIGVDAEHGRVHLDGSHLVLDWRHVHADTDAVVSIGPDDNGLYAVPALRGAWIRTRPGSCDLTIEPTGPAPTAILHQRCPDGACTVTVFTDGQRLPDLDLHVFDIDPGRGHHLDGNDMPAGFADDLTAAACLGSEVHTAVRNAYTSADWKHWA
ncbi:hypothetical protein [Catellatospora methionotrophica]|uniref:hypothetical protein n=1 Tax=Catellatospora methionotrophica TaxID=121620 RepID=UPI0033EE84C1